MQLIIIFAAKIGGLLEMNKYFRGFEYTQSTHFFEKDKKCPFHRGSDFTYFGVKQAKKDGL